MSRKQRIYRAADHQPAPRRRFYCHDPETKPVSRTVSRAANPWHDGIREAKNAGAAASRGGCLYAAKHTTERVADVCTDYRIRERDARERKEANSKKAMYRRWGLVIE